MTAPLFLLEPGALEGVRPAAPSSWTARRDATPRPCGGSPSASGWTSADGSGALARCTVLAVGKDELTLRVDARDEVPEPAPRFVLVQALAKGERDDLAIEAATELGVDEVVPWQAERSVVVWRGERGVRSRRKWEQTVRAAAKQSRRARVPGGRRAGGPGRPGAPGCRRRRWPWCCTRTPPSRWPRWTCRRPARCCWWSAPRAGSVPAEVDAMALAGATHLPDRARGAALVDRRAGRAVRAERGHALALSRPDSSRSSDCRCRWWLIGMLALHHAQSTTSDRPHAHVDDVRGDAMATEGLLGAAGPEFDVGSSGAGRTRAEPVSDGRGCTTTWPPGPAGERRRRRSGSSWSRTSSTWSDRPRRPTWAACATALDGLPPLPGRQPGHPRARRAGRAVRAARRPASARAVAAMRGGPRGAARATWPRTAWGSALAGADPLRPAGAGQPGRAVRRDGAALAGDRAVGGRAGDDVLDRVAAGQPRRRAAARSGRGAPSWCTCSVRCSSPCRRARRGWPAGRPGWRSTRQRVWGDLDVLRCGPLRGGPDPAAEWADYALDAPVMLVRSGDRA